MINNDMMGERVDCDYISQTEANKEYVVVAVVGGTKLSTDV